MVQGHGWRVGTGVERGRQCGRGSGRVSRSPMLASQPPLPYRPQSANPTYTTAQVRQCVARGAFRGSAQGQQRRVPHVPLLTGGVGGHKGADGREAHRAGDLRQQWPTDPHPHHHNTQHTTILAGRSLPSPLATTPASQRKVGCTGHGTPSPHLTPSPRRHRPHLSNHAKANGGGCGTCEGIAVII